MTEVLSPSPFIAQMQELAERAESLGLRRFCETDVPDIQNVSSQSHIHELTPRVDPNDPRTFWRGIASIMIEAGMVMEAVAPSDGSCNLNSIAKLQALASRRTRFWLADSFCHGNDGDRMSVLEVCSAFIEAARAFSWNDPEAIGLFGYLNEAVKEKVRSKQ